MPALTKDQIKAAQDLRRERVEVPEWGGYLFIRRMTGAERDDWENDAADRADAEARLARSEKRPYDWKRVAAMTRARVVAWTACDDEGNAIFGKTEADVVALSEKSGDVLDRLFTVAMGINGLSRRDVEDILGKFGAAPSGSSRSDSA